MIQHIGIHVLLGLIIGAIRGSFGSVFLYRLADKPSRKTIKNILRGRSKDFASDRTLQAGELIPVRSWYQARHQGIAIPTLYRDIEIGCALVFAVLWGILASQGYDLHVDLSTFVVYSIIQGMLMRLLIWDIHRLYLHLPTGILTAIIVWGNLIRKQENIIFVSMSTIWMIGGFVLLYIVAKYYARKRYALEEGIGLGDVLLMIIIAPLWSQARSRISHIEYIISRYHYEGSMEYIYMFFSYTSLASLRGLIFVGGHTIYRKYNTNKRPNIKRGQSAEQHHDNTKQAQIVAFFPGMIMAYRTLYIYSILA